MVARFRPNSPSEAVTCGNDGSVYFWNTRTGQRIGAELSHREQMVYTAAFDATGDRFAFAGRGKVVRICDFDTRRAFPELRPGHWNIRPFPSFGPSGSGRSMDNCSRTAGLLFASGPVRKEVSRQLSTI